MTFLFNILLAWISTISLILLSIIWLIRIGQKKGYVSKDSFLAKINKFLRKKHIPLGYIFLISGFFHGMFSSYSLFSFNFGTIGIIIGFLILGTFNSKVSLGKKWMKYHRQLTALLLVITVVHIVEVGGFVGLERIYNSIENDFKSEEKINSNDNLEDKDDLSLKYKDGIIEAVDDALSKAGQ